MKKILHLVCSILIFLFFACSSDSLEPVSSNEDTNGQSQDEADPDNDDTPENSSITDSFDGTGPLEDFVTNNETALPKVEQVDGRYRAELTDNANNKTLHFNNEQGRLDAKLVSFPFEFIARNIGIGTLSDSQTPPTPQNSPIYIFQVFKYM